MTENCFASQRVLANLLRVVSAKRGNPPLYVDSSFYKQSMKIVNYHKIKEWIDSSIGQSTVIQNLDKKSLHYPD